MATGSFASFQKRALHRPDVKAEYDALGPAFEMKRQMIALRMKADLTQEQMAERLGIKKYNISRLESLSADVSPRLSTIEQYARVLGYKLKIGFEPNAGSPPNTRGESHRPPHEMRRHTRGKPDKPCGDVS